MIQRFLAYAASSSANLAEVFNPAWVVGVFGNITKLISQILGDNLDILVGVLNNISNNGHTNFAANRDLAVEMVEIE